MTAPDYAYGGNGMKERSEYIVLKGESLTEATNEMSTMVDALLNRAYIDDDATHSTSVDKEMLLREATLSYLEPPRENDSFFAYDSANEGIVEFEAPDVNYKVTVAVSHQSFTDAALHEAYSIKFERALPYTEGKFSTEFTFELFAGGHISAIVTSNNIDVDDGIPGDFYTRPVTSYDMSVFHQEADAMLHYSVPSFSE